MVFPAQGFAVRSLARKACTAGALASLLALTACQGALDGLNAAEAPLPRKLVAKIKAMNMSPTSPIMVRIFKQENVLEVWKAKANGRYALLADYEICKWSGKLGPKFKEGDRQAPEGFYMVNRGLMNPNSKYHLAFNMGFPNAYDRSHGRTGSHLMVHGACSSAGCYSMTDEQVQDIYALARDAFRGGQRDFQIQAFPFRMTPANMAKHSDSPHFDFWKMLKEGYDHFELTKVPPTVNTCGRKYVFNVKPVDGGEFNASRDCPALGIPQTLATSYLKKLDQDNKAFEKLLAKKQGRDARELPQLTYATAFPGIQILGAAKKPEVETPKAEDAKPAALAAPEAEKPLVPAAGAQPANGAAPAAPENKAPGAVLPVPAAQSEIPADPVTTGSTPPQN